MKKYLYLHCVFDYGRSFQVWLTKGDLFEEERSFRNGPVWSEKEGPGYRLCLTSKSLSEREKTREELYKKVGSAKLKIVQIQDRSRIHHSLT